MTARDTDPVMAAEIEAAVIALHDAPEHAWGSALARYAGLIRQLERAEVLLEAADFVRDAHFRDGLSVQEIGTALRFMADAATPTSKEQQR